MSILIQKSGILTTLQDLGRNRFRRFGINPNGVMDRTAARLVNVLLGNDQNEGVLEIHYPAPQILFEENAIVALGGADFSATVDGKAIENWRPVFIEKKSLLKFDRKISGNRIYLSVKGGFKIEKWLGSASTNLTAKIGGFRGRALQKDDRLDFNSTFKTQSSNFSYKISKSLIPLYSSFPVIRVTAGAEFEKLTVKSREHFLSGKFTIRSESDRMGFRLKGENLNLRRKIEMISSAVDFGTIQLLPDGQMIILMAEHQTTGGYPRIAHIVGRDLPLAGQLGANDKMIFALVPLEEAENLALEFEKDLNMLKIACSFKN
jgi:antagonist of KipI